MSAKSSIRFRLMAANVLVKQVVIVLAGLFLLYAFEGIVRDHIARELSAAAGRLAAATPLQNPASAKVSEQEASVAGPERFWQITRNGEAVARSPSLGSNTLDARAEANSGGAELAGPGGKSLFAIVRTYPSHPGLEFMTAIDNDYIAGLRRNFRNFVFLSLGGIAALLLTSAWIQVNVGLRPAEMLRNSIERVRLGTARRIGEGFPDELKPLIDEANRLLEAQEFAVQKARARAGDLAHGLKTPLTAISMLNEQLRDAGEADIADEIDKHIEAMSRHVYRELTRTRIAASSGLSFSTDLHLVAERVKQTLKRLPKADNLEWRTHIEQRSQVALEEDDAIELLANLADNARKWASSIVAVDIRKISANVVVSVEDDGPGVPEENFSRILQRGVRLDESVPGTGIGLTIVKDIVEAYGGGIDLSKSPLGGLGVKVTLPAAGTVVLLTAEKPDQATRVAAPRPGTTEGARPIEVI